MIVVMIVVLLGNVGPVSRRAVFVLERVGDLKVAGWLVLKTKL